MYESFFGLTKRPFSLRPDPDFLYLSRQHSVALSMLEFSLTGQAGFVVVTGEIGSGKTTLVRHFLRRSDRTTTIGLICNTHSGMGDILPWVSQALNIETRSMQKSACHQALLKYLSQQALAEHQVVLVVDEAQNLSVAALEELRLLSNMDLEKGAALQIILVGQPELIEKLQDPGLRQFVQRIAVHYHLTPLTYSDSCSYVRHRLSLAGAKREIFDAQAIGAVYYFSGGIPRVMNVICDLAMTYAFAAGKSFLALDLILAVVSDREKYGIQVMAKRAAETTREALIEAIEHQSGELAAQQVASETTSDPPVWPDPSTRLGVDDRTRIADRMPRDTMITHSAIEHVTSYNGASPSAAAVCLSEEVFHRHCIVGRPDFDALWWLRRRAASDRGHT